MNEDTKNINDMITNATSLPQFNVTSTAFELDYDLYQKYKMNRSVSDTAYWIILIAYTILIVMGTIGNLLVVLAVATNKGRYFYKRVLK